MYMSGSSVQDACWRGVNHLVLSTAQTGTSWLKVYQSKYIQHMWLSHIQATSLSLHAHAVSSVKLTTTCIKAGVMSRLGFYTEHLDRSPSAARNTTIGINLNL